MLPDTHIRSVNNDVIHCKVPPPNLNFVKKFSFGAKMIKVMTANISSYTVC